MFKFKFVLLSLFLPVFLFAKVSNQKSETKVDTIGGRLIFSNSLVSIDLNLVDGHYSITDKADNTVVFENASFMADGWDFSTQKAEKSNSNKTRNQQINWLQVLLP